MSIVPPSSSARFNASGYAAIIAALHSCASAPDPGSSREDPKSLNARTSVPEPQRIVRPRVLLPDLKTVTTAPAAGVNPAAFNVSDACLSIANVHHVECLQEVGSLQRQVKESQLRYLSGNTRILRQKMNSFLESSASPDAFVVSFRNAMEDVRVVRERNASRLANIEAIVRNDGNEPPARKVSAWEALVLRSDKQRRRRPE